MKYVVLKYFEDAQDEGAVYNRLSLYPRSGYSPTKKRIAELSTNANGFGVPVIAEIAGMKEYEAELIAIGKESVKNGQCDDGAESTGDSRAKK